PDAPWSGERPGTDEFVAEAGFRYFFTDAHQAAAGTPLSVYEDDLPMGAERFDLHGRPQRGTPFAGTIENSPYQAYRLSSRPGAPKLWRVTGNAVDLGDKQPYDPTAARWRARDHAKHFVHLLDRIARDEAQGDSAGAGTVVVSPFDTELFGHWWFEGPDFLGAVYRSFNGDLDVHPTTASHHLRERPPTAALQLAAGSWGANGDYSMWLNDET